MLGAQVALEIVLPLRFVGAVWGEVAGELAPSTVVSLMHVQRLLPPVGLVAGAAEEVCYQQKNNQRLATICSTQRG